MAKEIERRFLVHPELLPANIYDAVLYRQIVTCYFTGSGRPGNQPAIRVAYSEWTAKRNQGKVTFKFGFGESREEFEFVIGLEDAKQMIALGPTMLVKTRFEIDGWEVDKFDGFANKWLAEWESSARGELPYPLPPWIGDEVTNDARFTNEALAWSKCWPDVNDAIPF